MGVEYAHGMFVTDFGWRPTWDHVDGIQRVLERWQLADGAPQLFGGTGYRPPRIDRTAETPFPRNLRGWFSGTRQRDVVERVIGPSDARGDRYLGVGFVLGVDFRILYADSLGAELITPPLDDAGNELVHDDEAMAYPATWTTTPPVMLALEGGFDGAYRSAITFECGKDVPRICERAAPLPDPALRAELEAALGTALVETGYIH